MERKDAEIKIRMTTELKQKWKLHCSKRNISLTDLIISSVNKKMNDDERKKVLAFIEKQDNLFAKVENNINQLARIANGQKFLTQGQMQEYLKLYEIITSLKEEQNLIFKKIYAFISRDDSKNFEFGE